ncbi:MAG: helix-turn-helix domain-containing protein [Clostridia bacterium]|nr:helix-turn-helix domain-containing protein [Clostridia bacterium]
MRLPDIEYALRRTRSAGGNITAHSHESWEMVCYISGEGKTVCGNVSYDYRADTVCLIPPNTHHKEINTTETELVFCAFVPGDQECRAGVYNGDAEISQIAVMLASAMASRNVTDGTVAGLYLAVILTKLMSSEGIEGVDGGEQNRSLESAFHYIFDYYNTDIKPRELAASVGYSYDRFRHIFKDRFGITPKQMILYKRIDAAKQMLRSDGKIENIARDCGFGSASQFNVIFKKTQGMTPGEYRAVSRKRQAN